MPRLHGVGAWILVDGKELYEFGSEIENDKVVSCYVASDEGKQFQFKFENTLNNRNYTFEYTVDGEYLGGRLSCTSKDLTEMLVTGMSINETTEKPFIFTKLNTSDDDALILNNKEKLDKIGSIEVKVFEYKNKKPDLSEWNHSAEKLKIILVHERSKKIGSHQISLGDSRTKPKREFRTVDYVDPQNPLVTFVFRYRPRDILQAQGSNTQSVSSPTTGEKRHCESSNDPELPNTKGKKKARISNVAVKVEQLEENLSPKAIAAMKRQIQEMQEKINRAEGRVLVIHDDDDVDIKREPSPICVLSTSQGATIVIDLT
ncbi:hypothetical protein C8Q75DRAFT_282666 [Abortiporus biennis]|nr:hypothetical protein C8Q75DRAFT_282666 [Abortiporus biennis]